MNKYLTGNEIREIRETLSVNQKEFASTLGITAPYLSDIERGIKKPSQQLINFILLIKQVKEKTNLSKEAETWKNEYLGCMEKLVKANEKIDMLTAPPTGAEQQNGGSASGAM